MPRAGFWSGQTLKREIEARRLIDPPKPGGIDCNAYKLSMGPEYFVTSPRVGDGSERIDSAKIKKLEKNEAFIIPAGQFAFLLSEETVEIPADAMAFISMRSHQKWKGLINVSGFHVDPGYKGRLVFSVYNAGPIDYQARRGDEIFLIWYCSLDEPSEKGFQKTYDEQNLPRQQIDASLVDSMSGHVYSPLSLIEDVRQLRGLKGRIDKMSQRGWTMFGSSLTFFVVVLGLMYFIISSANNREEQLAQHLSSTDERLRVVENEQSSIRMDARLRGLEEELQQVRLQISQPSAPKPNPR